MRFHRDARPTRGAVGKCARPSDQTVLRRNIMRAAGNRNHEPAEQIMQRSTDKASKGSNQTTREMGQHHRCASPSGMLANACGITFGRQCGNWIRIARLREDVRKDSER